MKENLSHPYFKGFENEDTASKIQLLTEQLELLEKEMAKRIKELIWA